MKKTYRLICENEKGLKHIEIAKLTASVDYWLKMAKKDEKDGCYVEMQFSYDSITKELILQRYYTYNKKAKIRDTITLIKNKEQLQRLNKK